MTDIIIKNPFYPPQKLNLIQIKYENADGSTKSENQECMEQPSSPQNPSSLNDIEVKSKSKLKKKDIKNRHIKHLGKKTKRNNDKNINKIKKGKNKLLFKVFNEFKISSPLYK